MANEHDKIRITLDEVEQVTIDPIDPSPTRLAPPPPTHAVPKAWGRVDSAVASTRSSTRVGAPENLLLTAWVYLSIAGVAGAFVAWALCEPSFHDTGRPGPGNSLIFPAFVVFVSVGFAVAESVVERSWRKAAVRCTLAVVLGIVLGFVFDFIAEAIYHIGLRTIFESGSHLSNTNPAVWLVRAIAWSVFGVTGGLVYGVAGQSSKKCMYGVIGGVAGAAVGGLLFDPVNILAGVAGPSRCLGLMIMGGATGAAVGLVESALKDRWLFVSAGPLAGKQFILYKAQTRIGSDQASDIYLFKDASISSQHAIINVRSGHAVIAAVGPTYVSGQPVTEKTLRSGDVIQIGRYSFSYQEKQKQQ